MKKKVTIVWLAILAVAVLLSGMASAKGTDKTVSAIIVFKDEVIPEDVRYLEALGGVIKYQYSIIDGVAVELPQAALHKLMKMRESPDAPDSDPIARRIDYIEKDQMMYALGSEPGPMAAETQAAPPLETPVPDQFAIGSEPVSPASVVAETQGVPAQETQWAPTANTGEKPDRTSAVRPPNVKVAGVSAAWPMAMARLSFGNIFGYPVLPLRTDLMSA